MKPAFSLILTVLFFFAIQMQSLTVYAHIDCDHQHTQETEHHQDAEHKNADQTNEACNHQHHCCHSTSSAYQAPKSQSPFLNIDLISFNFPSFNELAIEAPILEGPFQPPRA